MLPDTRVNRSRGIFSNSTHIAGSQPQQQSFHLRNTELRRLLELDQSKQHNNSSNTNSTVNPKNNQNDNSSVLVPIDSQANKSGTQVNNNNKVGRRVTLNTILGYPLDVKIPKKERKKLRSDQWTSTLDIQNLRGSCSIINSQGETQSVSPSRVRVSMPVIEEYQQIVQAEKQQQEAKTPGIMKIIQIKQEKELNRLDMKIEQFNRKNPVIQPKLPVFFFPDQGAKRSRSQETKKKDSLNESMQMYKQNTNNYLQQISNKSMIFNQNEDQNQHNISSSVLQSSSSLKVTEKQSSQTDEQRLRIRPPAISIQDSAKLRQPSKHLVKVVKSQSVYEPSQVITAPQQSSLIDLQPIGVHHPSMSSNSNSNNNFSNRTNQNNNSNRNSPKQNYYLSMPKILKRQTEVFGEQSYQQQSSIKKHDLSGSIMISQKSLGQLQQSQQTGVVGASPLRTYLQPLVGINKGDNSINQSSSSNSSSDNEDYVGGAVTFEKNNDNHNNEDPSSSSPSHLFKLRLRSLSPTNKRHLLEQIDLQRRKTLKQQQLQSPKSPQIKSKPSSPIRQTSNQKKISQSEEKSLPFLLFPSQFFQKKSSKKSINRGVQGNLTAFNSLNNSNNNSKKNIINQQQPQQSTFPSQQLSNLSSTYQKPSTHHQLTSQGYLNQIMQKSLSKQADLSAIRGGTPLSREMRSNLRKIRCLGEESHQKSTTNINQSNNNIKIPSSSSTYNQPEAATNAYIDAAVSKKLLKYQFAADEACIGLEIALKLDTKAMKEIEASEFDCETLSFYYRKYLQAAISGYAKSNKAKDEILQGDEVNDNDENTKEEQKQKNDKLNPKELFVLFRVSHELFDRLQMILQTRLKTLHVPQDIEKGVLSSCKWLKNSVVASNVLEELGSGSIVSQLVTQVAKEIQINTNIQLLSFLDNNNNTEDQQLSKSIDPQILQSKEKSEELLDNACQFFIQLLSDQHAKVNSTLEYFLSQRFNFTQIEFFLLKNYTFHTLLPTIKKHIILAALEKIESLRMKILPSQGDQAILSKPNSFQLLLFQLNSKCGKNLQRLMKKKQSKIPKEEPTPVALKRLEAKKLKEQKKKGIGRGVSFSDFIQQKARSQQERLNEIAENDEDKQTNYPDGFENSPYFPRKPMIREQPAVTSLHLILNPSMHKQGSIEEVVFSPPSLKYIEEKGDKTRQNNPNDKNNNNTQVGSQIIQISLSQLQNEDGDDQTQKNAATASSLSPKRQYSRPPKLLQRLASIHGSNYNIQTNTVSFPSPKRIQNESLNLNTSNSSNNNIFDVHMFDGGNNIPQSLQFDPTKQLKPNDSQDLLRLSLNFLLSSPNLLCMARLVETQLKSPEDFLELTKLMMIELKNQEAVALSDSMLLNLQVRILKVQILLNLENVYFGLFQNFHDDIEELLKEEVDLYCEVNCSVEVAIFAKALDMKFLSFVIDLVFTHFDIFNADDIPIAKQFFSIADAALNIQLLSLETVLLSQRNGKDKEGQWFKKQSSIKGFIRLLREILLPYQKR